MKPIQNKHKTTMVSEMIEDHRKDPGAYHTFPFPINYQQLGGEGKNLAPVIKKQKKTMKSGKSKTVADFAARLLDHVIVHYYCNVAIIFNPSFRSYEWLRQNAESEPWQWINDTTLITSKQYAMVLIDKMEAKGFTIYEL
jgi:hypothetical protein